MASRDFNYGSIEIYLDKVLGVGSYGKVCKAKCGQLPCAAKLLHDTLFQDNDPGTITLARKFEQECQFLSNIKHPNIVQYLGTVRDPMSQRPILLMELMDESLTRFLERSTLGLPYHSQLNICHDVALALAYLHSNTIIHRDLSSNNVLLIGEGSRTKVTDFGMSKLTEMNPRMTPLTQCPGTLAYMPPEALITPPHYSSKLDIFSHGVLTIQIITRNFPNPGDANIYVHDPKYPSGRVLVQIPEADRRKKDIDLLEADHPLLLIALHCIKDIDTERPSSDELCEGLASLKSSARYRDSVEQTRERTSSAQRLQLEASKQVIRETNEQDKDQSELLGQVIEECQMQYQQELQEVKMISIALEMEKERLTAELSECRAREQQYREELEAIRYQTTLRRSKTLPRKQRKAEFYSERTPATPVADQREKTRHKFSTTPLTLTWRQGKPAPVNMSSLRGASVVHGNIAYFSQGYSVYSYTLAEDKWTQLQQCQYEDFSLAVVNDKLTTIGGSASDGTLTNSLLSLAKRKGWKELLPPMPTPRVLPATVTTTTHLVIAGGGGRYSQEGLSTVEVMDTDTLQWSTASSLPQEVKYPLMTSCGGYLYISNSWNNTVCSCSVEGLLQSCQLPPDKYTSINSNSKDGSVWTRLAEIHVSNGPTLTTLGGNVLAIGGVVRDGLPTGAIRCYDRATNSWRVTGEMPTPRHCALAAVLPGNELIVVGGKKGSFWFYNVTEIGEVILL